MTERKQPAIQIELGAHTRDAKVIANGEDITHCLRGVLIESDLDKNEGLTSVTLRLVSTEQAVRLCGAIEVVNIESRLADVTALGGDQQREKAI